MVECPKSRLLHQLQRSSLRLMDELFNPPCFIYEIGTSELDIE